MKFLDLAGVQQFKDYNDSKYVVTEDVVDLTAGSLDFYTKDEIDEMLENFDPELTETDPVFTASAASGITSTDISNWNSKQDAISDLATIRSNAADGAAKVSNVQADWNATSGLAQILHKPTIPAEVTESTVSGWGFTKNTGTLTTETDPVFSASAAAGITASDITNWNSKTDNVGTITGITMNGASKGTSGVIDLGTVITSHQDISGKADKSAAIGSLSLSLDSTNYKITLSGAKVDGTTFTVSNVIDLPLESVVVNGSYNNTTKKVVLTLQNGNTVDFSVADLVSGLQSEITSTNKLSADLISDGTTNKTVTATEKSTWNGKQDAISDLATIRSNAEAGAAKVSNVQSDWNANSGLAQILNKPTIPTVGEGELTIKVNGTTIETFGANQGDDDEIDISIPTESTVSGWGFTKNTGTYSKPSGGIPASDLTSAVQTSLGKADTALQSFTETDPVYSASAAAGITSSDISNWNSKTSNVGTITGITMNGSSKGTSGVVNLGTVVTSETDPVFTASAAAGITSTDITNWNNKVSNVQSDWNATTGAAVILNKPTIPNDSGLVHTTGNETIGGTKTITGTLSFGGSEGGANSKIVLDEDSELNMYFATMNLASSSINTIASDWSNIIRKATANGTATTLQQDLDAKQNAITSTNKLDYSLLTNTPTIPAAPGTLKTNNTTAQTASASEALSGTINLHKVAKTGTYSDLIGTPTIPTESTVSGWGFTKNSGTVTGVKMNGTTKTPTSGTVDLGTVITSETSLSKGTTTGSGNAVTDISVSGHQITLTKGSTFLTSETQLSKGTTSGSGNVVTDLSVSGHTVTLTKGSNVPVATSANAGKIPMITSSGGWEYVTPSAIYSGSAAPNNNTGNNGDIYLQTS